jgi:hypothetical protein
LPSYAAFLDAEKAFGRIDRNLMLYKLLKLGINGNVYENVKNIYNEAHCSINVNNCLTDWFQTESGVKQGDTISPTLFNIFINDLVADVNSLNKGIRYGNDTLSILLYADDIVLLCENPDDLQDMLKCVYSWSKKNIIKFNPQKSNIMHFRKSNYQCTDYEFFLGNQKLNIVDQYKYLGVVLNENLNYNITARVLSDAANRGLGSLINKYKHINGLGFNTYTKLFNCGVAPILDYCSEIWGFKYFKETDNIQNKAIL